MSIFNLEADILQKYTTNETTLDALDAFQYYLQLSMNTLRQFADVKLKIESDDNTKKEEGVEQLYDILKILESVNAGKHHEIEGNEELLRSIFQVILCSGVIVKLYNILVVNDDPL